MSCIFEEQTKSVVFYLDDGDCEYGVDRPDAAGPTAYPPQNGGDDDVVVERKPSMKYSGKSYYELNKMGVHRGADYSSRRMMLRKRDSFKRASAVPTMAAVEEAAEHVERVPCDAGAAVDRVSEAEVAVGGGDGGVGLQSPKTDNETVADGVPVDDKTAAGGVSAAAAADNRAAADRHPDDDRESDCCVSTVSFVMETCGCTIM